MKNIKYKFFFNYFSSISSLVTIKWNLSIKVVRENNHENFVSVELKTLYKKIYI